MHEIYKKQNLPYLAVKLCPNCNELVPVEKDICPNCFYNFSSKEINIPSMTDTIKINNQSKTEEKKVIINVAVKEKEMEVSKEEKEQKFLYCECCGAKINEGQIYCGECGTRVTKVFCKKCQNLIDATLMFCPFCGNKQERVLAKTPIQPITYPGNDYQQPTIVVPPQQIETPSDSSQIVKEDSSVLPSNDLKVDEPAKEETEKITLPVDKKDLVNMGRKRLFMILQLIVVLLIAALLTVMPLIGQQGDNFFTTIIPSFKAIQNPSIIKGYDWFAYLLEWFKSLLGKNHLLTTELNFYFDADKQKLIFSTLPFIGSKITSDVVMIVLAVLYGFSYLFLLLAVIVSIVGLFSRKPVKGRSMGAVTIVLFIFTLLTIVHPIIDKQETIALYLFVLSFIFWFLIKLVFFKENRRYNKAIDQE